MIPAPPGIHAWVVFLLHYNHLRTGLQHFPTLCHQAVQALPVRDNGDKFQLWICFFFSSTISAKYWSTPSPNPLIKNPHSPLHTKPLPNFICKFFIPLAYSWGSGYTISKKVRVSYFETQYLRATKQRYK